MYDDSGIVAWVIMFFLGVLLFVTFMNWYETVIYGGI